MHCRMKVEKPDEIEYTLTITMNAGDWMKLRDQLNGSTLSNSFPSWRLIQELNDLLAQARKVYWPSATAVLSDDGRDAS